MFLGWSSTKIAEIVLVHNTFRSQELKIDLLTENLKNLLVWNQKAQVFDIWYVASSTWPLPKLFKL